VVARRKRSESCRHGAARDVSERNVADDKKRLHLQELELLNKELDDFVHVVSHDLRSPLRAITSLAQWVIDDDAGVDRKTRERLLLFATLKPRDALEGSGMGLALVRRIVTNLRQLRVSDSGRRPRCLSLVRVAESG
jgi:signal transduction histidine kinase